MDDQEEHFEGNDKHYKMLHKALSSNDISIWNSFAASMGAGFRPDLKGIDLTGARLAGVHLARARLDGAILNGCDLKGADLTGASLVGATFRDAQLEGARLPAVGKVRVRSKAPENPETLDPETRRRLKIARTQDQAREFLQDRARKEAALAQQKAQVKVRNNPSPFANQDR